MEARELRIGNIVEYEGQPLPILSIDSERENSEYKLKGTVALPEVMNGKRWGTKSVWLDNVKPIEITEEWLLSFGFAIDPIEDDERFAKLKYGDFEFMSDYSVDFKSVYIRLNKSTIELKYVHQLQNLYFALTNQELIKQ